MARLPRIRFSLALTLAALFALGALAVHTVGTAPRALHVQLQDNSSGEEHGKDCKSHGKYGHVKREHCGCEHKRHGDEGKRKHCRHHKTEHHEH